MIEDFLNPTWRLRNLYKIVDKNADLVTYTPNEVQARLHADPSKRKVTLKARQFGITTDAVIRRFDSCIWNRNKNVCILAHKQDVLDKIFKIVKVAYDNLPAELRPRLDKGGGSKYEYRFPDLNSTIYTTLEVRGGTIHELHVSEAAFIPKDRLDATFQAVPLDGIVEVESTPNGLNHFYDLWRETSDSYSRFFFPWYFHREYQLPALAAIDPTDDELRLIAYARSRHGLDLTHEQLSFRRHKIRELGQRVFQQEYPEDDQSCFLASGHNPFDTSALADRLKNIPSKFTVKNQIKIYEPFDKTKNYVIGADVAEGVRSDYSVAVAFCVETKKEVAFYRGHCSPSDFAEKLKEMGELYARAGSWPIIIVERNNHGHAVLLKLREILNYPRIWLAPDQKLGHLTTSITRPLLVDTFIEAVNAAVFEIRSKEIYHECMTLVDNGGRIEAETGKHDDTVIAAALGIKLVLEQLPKLNLYRNIESKILV